MQNQQVAVLSSDAIRLTDNEVRRHFVNNLNVTADHDCPRKTLVSIIFII